MTFVKAYECERERKTYVTPFTKQTEPVRIAVLDMTSCALCRAKFEAFLAGRDDLRNVKVKRNGPAKPRVRIVEIESVRTKQQTG